MNTDKIDKLIADAEKAAQGKWLVECGETWTNVEAKRETVAHEISNDNAAHIVNTQPKNIIPILRSWLAMREALLMARREIHCECYPGNMCPICESLEAADKALEQLP